MTTSTSLGFRALLKTAMARSGIALPASVVSGLTPAAKAFFVAATATNLPRGAVWHVVPSDGEIDEAVADVGFFLAALEGLSGTARDRAVLPFPSHEITRTEVSHPTSASPRRALWRCMGLAAARLESSSRQPRL